MATFYQKNEEWEQKFTRIPEKPGV